MFNQEFVLMYIKFALLWAQYNSVNIEISDLLEKSYETLKDNNLDDISKNEFIINRMIPVLTRSFVPPAIRLGKDNNIFSGIIEE